jgi:ankyrin repeat protein
MAIHHDDELLDAIRTGDRARVERLLDEDRSLLHAAGPQGSSAILLAAYHGHPELAAAFVQRGASLDLFEASALGDLGRVRQLLDAAPEAVGSFAPDGFFPLALAAFFGHREIVRALLEHGAPVGLAARNPRRITALHAAVARHDADIVELLLDHGADPDARQERGYAPLHEAAAAGDETIARMLLEHGARLDARTDEGKTPLDLADERGQGRMLEWLEILGRGGGDAQPSA